MGLLDKLWDDTMGGPQPVKGVGKLRKIDLPLSPRSTLGRSDSQSLDSPRSEAGEDLRRGSLESRKSGDFSAGPDSGRRVSQSISIGGPQKVVDRTSSLPSSYYGSPASPSAAYSPSNKDRENVWRSVFHPGSNKSGMDRLGSSKFDNNKDKTSPTVYDWYNRVDV